MRTKWLMIFAAVVLLAVDSRSMPITIVDWGVGDYVTAHQTIGRAGTVTTTDYDGDSNQDRLRRADFDLTTPLSPTSGYSGTSATFYGGYDLVQFTNTSASPNFGDMFVRNGGASGSTTDDSFGWRVQINGWREYFGVAIVWRKSDFLNGGDTNNVFFDTASSLTISVGDIGDTGTTLRWENIAGRWLVSEGTQWYVSQTPIATGTGDKSLTFTSNGSDGFWAPIDFSSGVGVDLTALTYSDTNFTNITGVGFYLTTSEARQPDTTDIRYWWYVDDFTVVAAIPEPGSVGLLLGTGAILLIRRRMNRLRRA